MQIEISYKNIKTRYSQQIKEIITNLRKSKSKENKAQEIELKWYFNYYIQIQSEVMNGSQLIEHIVQKSLPPKPTHEENYQNTKKNTHVYLKACKGRGYWNSLIEIIPIPEEVDQYLIKGKDIEIKNQKRLDSMTPEQTNKEIQKCLKILGKDKSFVALSI